MTINIGKTKYMVINPSSNVCNIANGLKIGNTNLSQVHTYEYLGVHIDDKLTMGSQIDKVCINVQKKYGILRKICRNISQETA